MPPYGKLSLKVIYVLIENSYDGVSKVMGVKYRLTLST